MKLRTHLIAILLALAISNCNIDNKPDSNEEDMAKIKSLYPDWINGFMETRNPDDYFKNVSDDYVLMGCGFDPITSRDTIASEIKKLVGSDIRIKIADCQSQEIIIRDDIAIHRYTCFELVTSKADSIGRRAGFNYLDILTRTNGNDWKIHLHMAAQQ